MGGTFGFVLDMVFGTDEGFREYLWSAPMGMKYAMGSLMTGRFGRYIVTILFDMFFTVAAAAPRAPLAEHTWRCYCALPRIRPAVLLSPPSALPRPNLASPFYGR